MQKGLKIDGTMRALAIALGGAILTSVIAMFIPASVFESITGATGFSELVPATGAPLGDTARALVAFGFGALSFAALAGYLLRKPAAPKAAKAPMAAAEPVADDINDAPSFMDRMRVKIGDYADSRRNADAVTELSDLPKLRAGDAHPDAPPRRPISAHRDFGDVAGTPDLDVSAMTVGTEPVMGAPHVAPLDDVVELSAREPVHADIEPMASDTATLTNMVDRLERAVAERQDQITKLEALASAEIAKPETPAPPVVADAEPAIVDEPTRQTILEAVPSEPAKALAEDDMDAALRSALETLHRMNARTR